MLYRQIFFQLGLGATALLLFLVIFRLLQLPAVYYPTLGKFSHNYERIGDGNNLQIIHVQKPYIQPTEQNIYNWDADIYRTIRDFAYKPEGGYEKVRQAFFPLFPWLWKVSGLGSKYIGYLNYLLFVISLIMLSTFLVQEFWQRIFLFCIGVLMPAVIFYLIPYTEALFAFTMAVAVAGIFNRKYWLYFAGLMAMGMTRPAILIFVLAFGALEFIYFLYHRKFFLLIKELFYKLIPLITGFAATILYQYYYTRSWTALFDAQKNWDGSFAIPKQFSDWSVEGFGMSVFALIFFCLPAFIYLIFWIALSFRQKLKDQNTSSEVFTASTAHIKNYLFRLSLMYMLCMMLYTLLYKGGSLNSFSRYILSTPFFYITLFLLPEKLATKNLAFRSMLFLLQLFGLIIFLFLVEYGSERLSFSFMGMYLGIILVAVLIFEKYFSLRIKIFLLIILALPCLVWHTYLYNSFISNGWIFT